VDPVQELEWKLVVNDLALQGSKVLLHEIPYVFLQHDSNACMLCHDVLDLLAFLRSLLVLHYFKDQVLFFQVQLCAIELLYLSDLLDCLRKDHEQVRCLHFTNATNELRQIQKVLDIAGFEHNTLEVVFDCLS